MDRQHDDLGAYVHARVEVDHVVVEHTDTAARHALSDCGGIVRSVNAVHRAAEIHGPGAQRVAGAAGHKACQIRLPAKHLDRRNPVWPLGLTFDYLNARPSEALAGHANSVANGLATGEHEVKRSIRSVDDDRSGRFTSRIVDDVAPQN